MRPSLPHILPSRTLPSLSDHNPGSVLLWQQSAFVQVFKHFNPGTRRRREDFLWEYLRQEALLWQPFVRERLSPWALHALCRKGAREVLLWGGRDGHRLWRWRAPVL